MANRMIGRSPLICAIVLLLGTACRSTTVVDDEDATPVLGTIGTDVSARVSLLQVPDVADSALVATVTLVNMSDVKRSIEVPDSGPVLLRLFASNDTSGVVAFNSLSGKGGNRALRNIWIRPRESAQITVAITRDELRLANLGVGPYRGIVTVRADTPYSIDAGEVQFSPLR